MVKDKASSFHGRTNLSGDVCTEAITHATTPAGNPTWQSYMSGIHMSHAPRWEPLTKYAPMDVKTASKNGPGLAHGTVLNSAQHVRQNLHHGLVPELTLKASHSPRKEQQNVQRSSLQNCIQGLELTARRPKKLYMAMRMETLCHKKADSPTPSSEKLMFSKLDDIAPQLPDACK